MMSPILKKEYFLPTKLSRSQFYQWMKENSNRYQGCYLMAINRNPKDLTDDQISYVDAVEIALCFGWIDSTIRKINNIPYRRFSPRKVKSHWTELNKERCRRLIKIHQMTEEGRKILPDLEKIFEKPKEIIKDLQKDQEAYRFFQQTPELYQRIKLDNLFFYKKKDPVQYQKSLKHFLEACRNKKLYGNYNDFGRLDKY